MNCKFKVMGTVASVLAISAAVGFATAACSEKKDAAQQTSEASVSTNANGSVSRSFTECTISTNGNMVTEHRRETRTTVDADGNVLATTTSEYAQSYPVGEGSMASLTVPSAKKGSAGGAEPSANDSFLGLKFGSVFTGTNLVADADEPTLLRATFKPAKALAGFDDYYAYVTPKTHRVVKVYACAREEVDAGEGWRRHYLIEALEKRYRTWARPRSWCRPLYTFDIGSGRYVTACLADATADYETIVAAWDDAMLTVAADETEALREQARKQAQEKRSRRVSAAAEAF